MNILEAYAILQYSVIIVAVEIESKVMKLLMIKQNVVVNGVKCRTKVEQDEKDFSLLIQRLSPKPFEA